MRTRALAIGVPAVSILVSVVIALLMFMNSTNASGNIQGRGTFGSVEAEHCKATGIWTGNGDIWTRLKNNSTGWYNSLPNWQIKFSYQKWGSCDQWVQNNITGSGDPSMWCTGAKVDGVNRLCVDGKPKAAGGNCFGTNGGDVYAIYYPGSGKVDVVCNNLA